MAAWSDTMLVLATLQREHPAVTLDDHWKVFKDAGCEDLLRSINLAEFRDAFGNSLRIAARKLGDTPAEFIVWSPGRDGIFGNADDIIVPEELRDELATINHANRNE